MRLVALADANVEMDERNSHVVATVLSVRASFLATDKVRHFPTSM